MATVSDTFILRPLTPEDFAEVAALIHASTNAWYEENRGVTAFSGPPSDCEIFPATYESLDPGCCILAAHEETGRIAGSCFYHPRTTHVSLGIVNVHPDFFGRGVARRMLRFVLDFADQEKLSTRLVSSAMNLDSFGLYSRAGFVPRQVFQDMMVPVPVGGLAGTPPALFAHVRPATLADVPRMAALERDLCGIAREKDFRHFLENRDGVWGVSVLWDPDGHELHGFMVSCGHRAMNMVGPGVARNAEVATALLWAELNRYGERSPVVLAPSSAPDLVQTLYAWGARNIEIHLAQVRGPWSPPTGLSFPTFLPETA